MRKVSVAKRKGGRKDDGGRPPAGTVMRKTKKPTEQDRDEAFLLRYSSRSSKSNAAVSLDQVREELVRLLELARTGENAVDPTARAFSLGHASGLEDAIKILDRALQAEQAARIKAADQGKAQR